MQKKRLNQSSAVAFMDTSLATYVEKIRTLPDEVLRFSGILPEDLNSGNQGLILKGLRELHRAKSRWLEFYLLDRVSLKSELFFSPKLQSYKPYAEQAVATLTLCQEVFLKLDATVQEKVKTPALWWFLIQWDGCQNSLETVGILAEADSQMSKRKWADATYECLKYMENASKMTFGSATETFEASWLEALESIAMRYAHDDICFRNGIYARYRKDLARTTRTIRNDKSMNVAYLEADGSLKLPQKPRQSVQKKKGFVK